MLKNISSNICNNSYLMPFGIFLTDHKMSLRINFDGIFRVPYIFTFKISKPPAPPSIDFIYPSRKTEFPRQLACLGETWGLILLYVANYVDLYDGKSGISSFPPI